MTLLVAKTTFSGLVDFANTATGGIFVGLFMVAVFIVLLMAMVWRNGFVNSLIASGFICFLISLPLTLAEWINVGFPIAFISITALAVLFKLTMGEY